jgi:hypothetical protein
MGFQCPPQPPLCLQRKLCCSGRAVLSETAAQRSVSRTLGRRGACRSSSRSWGGVGERVGRGGEGRGGEGRGRKGRVGEGVVESLCPATRPVAKSWARHRHRRSILCGACIARSITVCPPSVVNSSSSPLSTVSSSPRQPLITPPHLRPPFQEQVGRGAVGKSGAGTREGAWAGMILHARAGPRRAACERRGRGNRRWGGGRGVRAE